MFLYAYQLFYCLLLLASPAFGTVVAENATVCAHLDQLAHPSSQIEN